jgi:hypothetical protein
MIAHVEYYVNSLVLVFMHRFAIMMVSLATHDLARGLRFHD